MACTIVKQCPLCGGIAPRLAGIDKPIYYHCPHCDLIFLDDSFIITEEDERRRYLLHVNDRSSAGYVKMLQQFVDTAIKPFAAGIKTGLDFGCGPGPVLSELLAETGVAMDIYDPYFYNHREIKHKKYDLITATEVFEHLKNPRREIDFLTGLLNPGGLLAVTTLLHEQYDFKNWWYRSDSTHICFYSSRTCRWIAARFTLPIKYLDSQNTCVWQKLTPLP
ncbi:MAG: class I SAM-dependent methyltransferase [Firmicutes bacterium]|nr:class I SAM-dependent methyltransferase [Bacillota bacterium]